MSGIAVEVSSRGIATITLDRPERSNAFDQAMLNALAQQFAERTADAATRVVVLRGAGKHFCGGADLVAAGIAPGPAVGRALSSALAARLDGRARGREAELAWALQEARSSG